MTATPLIHPQHLSPNTRGALLMRVEEVAGGHWVPRSPTIYVPGMGEVPIRRVALAAHGREVPAGHEVGPTCDHPDCVRATHLEILDPRRRRAVELRAANNSLRWIARELGVTVNTVRSWTDPDAREALVEGKRRWRQRQAESTDIRSREGAAAGSVEG